MNPESNVVQEKLSAEDINLLQVSRLNRQVAQLTAEKAIADNNTADILYKYTILQLYVRNNLSSSDAIDEQGNIHRNANVG